MTDDKLRLHLIEFLSTVTIGKNLNNTSILPFLKNIRKLWNIKTSWNKEFKNFELPETLIELSINGVNNFPKFPKNLQSFEIIYVKKQYQHCELFDDLLYKLPENLKNLTLCRVETSNNYEIINLNFNICKNLTSLYICKNLKSLNIRERFISIRNFPKNLKELSICTNNIYGKLQVFPDSIERLIIKSKERRIPKMNLPKNLKNLIIIIEYNNIQNGYIPILPDNLEEFVICTVRLPTRRYKEYFIDIELFRNLQVDKPDKNLLEILDIYLEYKENIIIVLEQFTYQDKLYYFDKEGNIWDESPKTIGTYKNLDSNRKPKLQEIQWKN